MYRAYEFTFTGMPASMYEMYIADIGGKKANVNLSPVGCAGGYCDAVAESIIPQKCEPPPCLEAQTKAARA